MEMLMVYQDCPYKKSHKTKMIQVKYLCSRRRMLQPLPIGPIDIKTATANWAKDPVLSQVATQFHSKRVAKNNSVNTVGKINHFQSTFKFSTCNGCLL